jgi:predicted ArsR family transcriptional regulator
VQHSYDYALIRLMPSIERGESLNVGVVLYCRTKRFLAAITHCDSARLSLLDPHCDLTSIASQLQVFCAVAAGDVQAGPIARLPQAERYHWLVAPRSTIIYTAPAHCGVCVDPQSEIERLMQRLVYTTTR